MAEIFAAEQLQNLRTNKRFKQDGRFSVIDELETAGHLVHATVLACESIEDLGNRNAFVALLDEIESRITACSEYMKALKNETTAS